MNDETMSGPPPVGVYQVGRQSPDNAYMAHSDPRIKRWLTSRDINHSTVYRVRLFSLGAWVFRFATEAGHFYKNLVLDEAERRLPLWAWQ